MVCPPVRGYPNALASELSSIHVDTHGVTVLYHIHEELGGSVLGCQTWGRRVSGSLLSTGSTQEDGKTVQT